MAEATPLYPPPAGRLPADAPSPAAAARPGADARDLDSGRLSADAPIPAPSPRQGAAARPLASGWLAADAPITAPSSRQGAAARPLASGRLAGSIPAAAITADRPEAAVRAVAAGRLLLETIICLVVLGMFSMFIFQKQLAQQKQLEEVNAAGAIRTLRDAVKASVASDKEAYPEGVTLKDASEFLPQEYFSGFRVAVRREGAKLSAIIVSPTSLGRYALDNLSAARISSMLGASGGFVPSLTDEPSSTANGTLGLWSLDINEISAEFADPVRIVVNIEFSEELGGLPAEEKEKILYRVADYGQASNTMLTALFFNDGTKDTIRIDPAAGTIEADGSITAGKLKLSPDGSISAPGFSVGANGAISALSLAATGPISGTTGTFTGAVKGTTGTFSGAVSGTTGTFTGAVKGTTGTFSGAVSGTTGTFSGIVRSTAAATVGAACNPGEIASDGSQSTLVCVKKKWSSGSDPDACETNNQGFTDKLFTANASFTIPCTGEFEIIAVGGGGGSNNNDYHCGAGGGGGASGFGTLLIGGGGGGGYGCSCGGWSGGYNSGKFSLNKGTSYQIVIGQGGEGAGGSGGCPRADAIFGDSYRGCSGRGGTGLVNGGNGSGRHSAAVGGGGGYSDAGVHNEPTWPTWKSVGAVAHKIGSYSFGQGGSPGSGSAGNGGSGSAGGVYIKLVK
ncbi:hypothetical protein FACS1894186_6320 [Alphaproteobacteria bacterium]|nr:hypothetical protein FACS1894186_6320 [Alphaproteobacteria bacterium]